MVQDANGEIARDYPFRIDPDPRFQIVLKARVVNDVVESIKPAIIRLRDLTTVFLRSSLRPTPTQRSKCVTTSARRSLHSVNDAVRNRWSHPLRIPRIFFE